MQFKFNNQKLLFKFDYIKDKYDLLYKNNNLSILNRFYKPIPDLLRLAFN